METSDKMSYGGFVFPENPEKIEISYERKIAEKSVPNGANAVWDFGYGGRTIKGSGEFFGSGAVDCFNTLNKVMKTGGVRALYLPAVGKLAAVFKELTLLEEDHENAIGYSFEFREVCNTVLPTVEKETLVLEDETLWIIARRTGIAVERLLEKNPDIRRPDTVLTQGERIVLR